jgi:hypothetical protein
VRRFYWKMQFTVLDENAAIEGAFHFAGREQF